MLNLNLHATLAVSSLLLFPSLSSAQATTPSTPFALPNNLPVCVQTCANIQAAVSACNVNTAAAGVAASSAAGCFCQFGALPSIKTAPQTNLCLPQCAQADFQSIGTWFSQYCADPANPGGNAGTQTTTTAPAAGGNPTTTTTDPAAATSSSPSYLESDDINRPESGSQWWHNHWEWVLMVIILVVAFTAIGVGGSIWHKRRMRRREGWDNPRPDMQAWAPSHHSVHDFGNPQNHQGPSASTAAVAAPGVTLVPPGKKKINRQSEAMMAPPGGEMSEGREKKGKLKKVLGR